MKKTTKKIAAARLMARTARADAVRERLYWAVLSQ